MKIEERHKPTHNNILILYMVAQAKCLRELGKVNEADVIEARARGIDDRWVNSLKGREFE